MCVCVFVGFLREFVSALNSETNSFCVNMCVFVCIFHHSRRPCYHNYGRVITRCFALRLSRNAFALLSRALLSLLISTSVNCTKHDLRHGIVYRFFSF
uniref:Putative secreted protein n=1 Tax=Anopheles marajoara TaxID=58244 RepID=A0A2M4C993_9DIPT